MQVVALTKLVLVPLHDALNFRLESFDSLGPDLVNPFLFPFLAAHFLAGHPSIFVFLQLHLIPLLNNLFLLRQIGRFILLLTDHLLNFSLQKVFVLQYSLNHVDLFLNPVSHLLLNNFLLFLGFFFD